MKRKTIGIRYMDSFEKMQQYMKKEMSRPIEGTPFTKEEKDARALVQKVQCCQIGNTYKEKAAACGVSYEDFMAAQRLIGKRY